jgi:hypothetical protein
MRMTEREMALIKLLTKTLLLLSLFALVGCSIDLSSPTQKPLEPIYIWDTPAAADPAAPSPSATPPWASARLSGHLIYIKIPRQIIKLDLASGQKTILFNAPNNAFVSTTQVSPDSKWIVMAYAPPEDPNLQSVNTDLYVIARRRIDCTASALETCFS